MLRFLGRFVDTPLYVIYRALQAEIMAWKSGDPPIAFEVIDPDASISHYTGEVVSQGRIYRSYRCWMELCEQLDGRLLTPQALGDGFVRLRIVPLQTEDSWHAQSRPSGDREKYGADTEFARIDKLEEPSFLIDYVDALERLELPESAEILNLGINKGDEFAIFSQLYPPSMYESMRFVGVDHAASALAVARERFPSERFRFVDADLNDLASLGLGRYDLIISIATLHSPALRSREIFHDLVRLHLKPTGHMILGFPNCRYLDHEIRYGAKMKNYTRPELSVLFHEVAYHKRYLQQHRFRVTVTGKHTLLLTAKRLPHSSPS
jgi:ubiquinone/menaquinone biosynthesis C-methylase UbiE